MHGRNSLKFDKLIYPDHLWNWLHSGHGILVFPHYSAILTLWNRSNVQFPGIFVTMYGRNGPKFVTFISNLWYPQKWKGQILAHANYPNTEWGYPWLLCSQTFLVLCYYRLTKPSPSTTQPSVGVKALKLVANVQLTSSILSWLHPTQMRPNSWLHPQVQLASLPAIFTR